MATPLRFRNLILPYFRLFATALMLLILLGVSRTTRAQVVYTLGEPGNTSAATSGDLIKKMNYDGTNGSTVITGTNAGLIQPLNVALDGNNNRIFVSEGNLSGNVIKVITGSSVTSTITSANSAYIKDINYDVVGNWLYYITEGGNITQVTENDALYRVHPDGTGTQTVAASITKNPYRLEVDAANNKVYVVDVSFSGRSIKTVDLANSNAVTSRAFATTLSSVYDVALDKVTGYLYYCAEGGSAATLSATDQVRRQNIDGTGDVQIAASVCNSPFRLGLDAGNNRLYVGDAYYGSGKIVAINLTNNTFSTTLNLATGQNSPQLYDFGVPDRPTVTTAAASSVAATSATLGGTLLYGYGLSTERGIVYSATNTTPTLSDSKASMATNTNNGAYSATVSGLSPATTYSARAYAISGAGTTYGSVITFSTPSNNANLNGLIISAGTLSPAFAAGTTSYTANVTYDKTTVTVTPTVQQANAIVKVNGTAVTSGTASGALSLKPGANIITTIVTAQDGVATQTYTTTITKDKTPQTITFNAPSAKTYGDADFSNLGASASSTLPVTYTSNNNNVATVTSEGVVHIVGAGTVTITAAQAGDATYLAASVSQPLIVNKATLTYTANTASRNYGSVNPTFAGTVTGFVNGESRGTATTGTPVFTSTAEDTSPVTTADKITLIKYAINGSGLTAANYAFVQATSNATALTLNKILLTCTVQPVTRIYGQEIPSTITVVAAGLFNGGSYSQTSVVPYSTTATKKSPAGNYPVTPTLALSAIYTYQMAASNATAFSITKADLIFTAAAATRAYGAANPTFGGTITGFVNNESIVDLTGTPSYNTPAAATTNVGSYPITLNGVSSDKYNFVAAFTNNTALSITKGTLSYVANAASRAFNTSPNPALTGTVTGFANGETLATATTGTPVFTTAVTQSTPVGTYAITGSGLTSSNYNIVQSPVNAAAFSIYLSSNGNLSSLAISQGTLSPAFSAGTNAYTATVSTGTTSITVTPALSDANAHVTVNGTEIAPGTASATIPLVVGANTIPVNVTAQDGTTTNPYTIVVTRLPSDDATLSSFSIAGVTLPTPDAYNNYRINVANAVDSYDVTAIVNEPNATIRINGVVIASGAVTTIPLHLGENVNNILVTAQDGTSFGYTGIIITRAYKSINLLSSLTVSTGTLSPAFDSATTNYDLEVSNATTTVDMTPVYDESASADEDGFPAPSGLPFTTVPLSIGYTEIPITVRAENGVGKTYRVNIHRVLSTDATLADLGIITTISGLNVPFDANTDTYNTTVTSDVTTFRLKPVATNDGSSITVNGVALNTFSGNSYTMKYFTAVEPVLIEVTAGDGVTKKTYTVNVTRNFSTNNFLATFGVNGYPITPDFDPAVNNYTINISDPSVVSLSMIPLAQDVNSELKVNSITINRGASPYVPLHGGANNVSVKVTAFGAGENIYTLTVNRAFSANTALGGLIVSQGGNGYSHVFDVTHGEDLDIDVPNSVSSLSIQPIAADAGGTVVTVNGYALVNEVVQVPIALGDNPIVIGITSGDNTATTTYTAHINRLPFVDVTLSGLTTTSGVLTPAFSPEVTVYTVVLPSTATTFSYSPVATSATSVVTVNSTVIDSSNPTYNFTGFLNATTNSTITVKAADGINTKTYRISFVKPSAGTAVLGNLSLSKGTLSPAFSRNTLTYTASVPYGTSTINITPYSPDPAVVTTVTNKGVTTTISTGTPSAAVALRLGLDTVSVITKSPSGAVSRTYTVIITRNPPATDATLAGLYVDNAAINPVFSPLQDTYTADVDNAVTSTFIRPTVTDTTATVTVGGVQVPRGTSSAPIALNQGNNIITTIVTAESGATKTYTTTINRLAPSANAGLTDLLVIDATLNRPFTTGQLSYTSAVANSVTSLTFIPLVTDPYATVTVNGVAPDGVTGEAVVALTEGLNTIEVEVTAQDGTTVKTYIITVTCGVATTPNYAMTFTMTPTATFTKVRGTANYNYTTSVDASVTSVVIKPKAADATAVVRVEGVIVPRGSKAAPIALHDGVNVIHMLLTATNGVSKTYEVTVNRNGSSNYNMTFTMTPAATFTKTAGTAKFNFVTSVDASVSSVIIKPKADEGATVQVEGVAVPRGASAAPITLHDGANVIHMLLTAGNGVSKTYEVTVNRAGSSNYNMTFTMTPAATFTKTAGTANFNFATSVDASVSSVIIKPKADEGASVQIEGVGVPRGTSAAPITLHDGANVIHMLLTAGNGVLKTYEVTVNRNGSSNYKLTYSLSPAVTLTATPGTSDYNFTGTVDPSVAEIAVKAKAADASSVVRVEGEVVPPGGKSAPITLLTGLNIIRMELTAGDGTVKTYEFAVTRPALGLMSRAGDEDIIIAGKTDKIAVAETADGPATTKGITVYPNPFVDLVKVDLKGYNAKQALVTVTTIQAVQLFNQTLPVNDNTVQVNLSGLKQGVYIINITVNGQRKGYRIFKN